MRIIFYFKLIVGCLVLFACKEVATPAAQSGSPIGDWKLISEFDYNEDEVVSGFGEQIEKDSEITLAGFRAEFNNSMSDSRKTPMEFESWKNIALTSSLSEEEKSLKLSMLGSPASIFMFTGRKSNHGLLVIKEKSAWAEIWDAEKIRRVRLDFDFAPDLNFAAPEICRELGQLRWP
jgi:hypothetical protein